MFLKKWRVGFAALLTGLVVLSCQTAPHEPYPRDFVKGADVSWVPQMEASGFVFRDRAGQAGDILAILKDMGLNTVRLRTWVHPSYDPVSGHNAMNETVALASRAKALGFRVMLDFHYSDTWADLHNQIMPRAWLDDGLPQLLDHVRTYTAEVLTAMKDAGTAPEWVQVGNEIDPGMLLPWGARSDMATLAQLINAGSDAVHSVCPEAKVILQLAHGADPAFCKAFFDDLTKFQTRYDVIGLSYYPWWDSGRGGYHNDLPELAANLRGLADRFHKPVMVVEVGGDDDHPMPTQWLLSDVLRIVNEVPGGQGLGMLYWEPEGAAVWSHYRKSAWNANGRPSVAMDAFRN